MKDHGTGRIRPEQWQDSKSTMRRPHRAVGPLRWVTLPGADLRAVILKWSVSCGSCCVHHAHMAGRWLVILSIVSLFALPIFRTTEPLGEMTPPTESDFKPGSLPFSRATLFAEPLFLKGHPNSIAPIPPIIPAMPASFEKSAGDAWTTNQSALTDERARPALFRLSSADGTVERPQVCRLTRLRAGSVVVIGSTDTGCGLHSVFIRSGNALPLTATDTVSVTTTDAVRIVRGSYSALQQDLNITVLKNPFSPIPAFHSSTSVEEDAGIARRGRHGDLSPTAHEPSVRRRFRVPQFTSAGSFSQIQNATLIASGTRVAVYSVDTERKDTSRHRSRGVDPLAGIAQHIVQVLENRLLPAIAERLSEISDLDGDGKISVVIADLDERSAPDRAEAGQPRIQGCVKREDFLSFRGNEQEQRVDTFTTAGMLTAVTTRSSSSSSSTDSGTATDFSGDIIYLDRHLPRGNALTALLAHELTHAAVYSVCVESEAAADVPVWLNEAVAHLMELAAVSNSANYRDRRPLFAARPQLSPVLLPDQGVALSLRRGGTRVAGTEFLMSLQTDRHQLLRILTSECNAEERIERESGIAFHQAFRRWSVMQAKQLTDHLPAGSGTEAWEIPGEAEQSGPRIKDLSRLPDEDRWTDDRSRCQQFQIAGTAFACVRVHQNVDTLWVVADPATQLQISVIDPTESELSGH